MKKLWVNVPKWDKSIVTTALESNADAVLVPKGFSKNVKDLGLIKTISEDGDIKLGKDVVIITINSKQDEINALKESKSKIVIVRTKDWTVIPLENLIAQTKGIIAEVSNSTEAKTALETLEKGVDGVLLNTTNLSEIKKTAALIKSSTEKILLVKAQITSIKAVGTGDRVCIDTCTNMKTGQGMLVGDSSSGMFLVHSESVENPYVEQRPFRINASAVHAYIKVPSGKTKYLSELKTGTETLIVDAQGNTEIAIVGRTKIEKRPLMLVEAVANGKRISLILQNAETIRLVSPQGKPVSIVKLKKGDTVLAYTEDAGRHFGIKIKETIIEK
ncbi:MAG TPA: 3-dehydroquinate synthase II [Candidatus Nanoarchaeia archaeon]|nr:3-dehydroquinate synthase II [Candidatus Nanoarchaeia archaeon]